MNSKDEQLFDLIIENYKQNYGSLWKQKLLDLIASPIDYTVFEVKLDNGDFEKKIIRKNQFYDLKKYLENITYSDSEYTPHQIRYYAQEITKKSSSDNIDKFTRILADAQVDLNPHQVDAALFAFKSPLSKGAILADEVGLGKTIEAGIILSQKWAEGKRKLLIICPSSLRKQWSQELLDKFYLKSEIVDGSSFKNKEATNYNPFNSNNIVICSYHFARNKEEYIKLISWDLAVLDEAHKLRGVYRNTNIISTSIKKSLENTPKLLLTATPLQNSLLELYGLTSFIDEHIFGDLKSYKSQFCKLSEENVTNFEDLKSRLAPVCKRTLRKQVLEYIKYTNRIPITQDYTPTQEEKELYDKITLYLQKPKLYALPNSQKHLITLILRKLLASSTFAIAGTLKGLISKLNKAIEIGSFKPAEDYLKKQFSEFDEISEELEDLSEKSNKLSKEEIFEIKEEIKELSEFSKLADSIKTNAKGEVLLTALDKGFSKLEELKAPRKILIFTEFKRTQEYILSLLSNSKYKDNIVLFNGSNSDERSSKIYSEWCERNKNTDKITGILNADKRSAIIDYFKDSAEIMIATEAAAEGINLQFCSLVINYDLPWNPQKIEQRIGRCHRYGQKYDVVVINFLNTQNEADKRVYELLDQKFKLFSGVFGASDDILGTVESGIDFEKRIIQIYQECRTEEEIKKHFDDLQKELDSQISENLNSAKKKLLENFDEEVHEKLRISLSKSKEYLNKFDKYLLEITRFVLDKNAKFDNKNNLFVLNKNPFKKNIKLGKYKFGKSVDDAYIYRYGCDLAQEVLNKAKNEYTPPSEINFEYTKNLTKSAILTKLMERKDTRSGEIILWKLAFESFETVEYLLFTGITKSGELLSKEQCEKIFDLYAETVQNNIKIDNEDKLTEQIKNIQKELKKVLDTKDNKYYDEEITKLDKWGEDRENTLRQELKELDEGINQKKRESRMLNNLPEKIKFREEIKKLEYKRDLAWKEYDVKKKEINNQVDILIEQMQSKMQQKEDIIKLFEIKWNLV